MVIGQLIWVKVEQRRELVVDLNRCNSVGQERGSYRCRPPPPHREVGAGQGWSGSRGVTNSTNDTWTSVEGVKVKLWCDWSQILKGCDRNHLLSEGS